VLVEGRLSDSLDDGTELIPPKEIGIVEPYHTSFGLDAANEAAFYGGGVERGLMISS
jgi:hypothetical protein